ncbi:hypothetical protein mRhiFer1_008908 [Rhinolophus ferrumequinum]|uniref:Uncharacterized protein n=1 Tax=Rhinolophus ferrumequinum TaxID=59479 RepID=A0A7J7TER6_RHIFE|nr:hypothetical protein mRhiFer1_008908 [Rhinolophus ferrumequinum]
MYEVPWASGEKAGLLGVGRGRAPPEPLSIKTARRDRGSRTAEERSLRLGDHPHPWLSPNCASSRNTRGRATTGVAVSASRKSLQRSPDPSPQLLCISDFGAAPSPTSPCLFAPRFFLHFARVLQPSIFASFFVLFLGGWGAEAAFAPLPLFILPCSDNPLFIAVGGPRIVASHAALLQPAARGRAPRNLQ